MGLKTFVQNAKSLFNGSLEAERNSIREIAEQRNASNFSTQGWLPFITSDSTTNESVSPDTAMRIGTVYSCVNFRSEAVSIFPIYPYKESGGKKVIDTKHPTYDLLSCRPNPWMNAGTFIKTIIQICDYYGNCYVYITRDERMKPSRLDILNTYDVEVRASNDSISDPNSLTQTPYYFYRGNQSPILATDILHFKHTSRDGKTGQSLITLHSETVGSAKKLRKFANRSISSTPPVYATTTSAVPSSTQAKDQLKAYLDKEMQSWFNNNQIPFLANGFELKTIGMSPADAMYLDQINATKEDIFSIFKTPPGLIGSYKSGVTYNNFEQQALQFKIYTLTPLLRMIEQEMNYKLFTDSERETRSFKFNTRAIMEMDHVALSTWYKNMFGMGVLSINDILGDMDMNPIDNGDDHYISVNNLMPVDMVREYWSGMEESNEPQTQDENQNDEIDNQQKNIKRYSLKELLSKKQITINVNGHAVEKQ